MGGKTLPVRHTIDIFLFASDMVTDAASRTSVTMAAMPPASNTLTELPHLFPRRDCYDVTNDLVTGDTGILDRETPAHDLLIAVVWGGENGARTCNRKASYLAQTPHASTFTTMWLSSGSFQGTVIFWSLGSPGSVNAYAVYEGGWGRKVAIWLQGCARKSRR